MYGILAAFGQAAFHLLNFARNSAKRNTLKINEQRPT